MRCAIWDVGYGMWEQLTADSSLLIERVNLGLLPENITVLISEADRYTLDPRSSVLIRVL